MTERPETAVITAKRKRSAFSPRPTSTARKLFGGCFICGGSDAIWHSDNAQGVAARHHDATGHTTWVEVAMSIKYG